MSNDTVGRIAAWGFLFIHERQTAISFKEWSVLSLSNAKSTNTFTDLDEVRLDTRGSGGAIF